VLKSGGRRIYVVFSIYRFGFAVNIGRIRRPTRINDGYWAPEHIGSSLKVRLNVFCRNLTLRMYDKESIY